MLQERIIKTLERRNSLDQRQLARVAGVNESTISRYLNGYDEISFESVLKIVKFLYGDEEKEVMAEYAITQKNQNARYAMEYFVMVHQYETTDQLIEILLSSNNPTDKEWAKMYQFISLRNKKYIEPYDLLQQLEEFKPRSVEMKVLKNLVKVFILFDLNDYHSLFRQIEGTEELIKRIKSKFIQNCFTTRLGLIMNTVCLYRNEIRQARLYNSYALDQEFFELMKGIAYHNLGNSFMFEDYDESKKNIELSIQIFQKFDQDKYLNIAMLNLSFLQSYWKIDREFTLKLDSYQNIANYIFYLIKKGNIILAKEYLSQINIESLSERDKAFYYYYQGLVNKDRESYYQSVYSFRKIGDNFYLQLPIQELQKLEENELVLKIFVS